MFLKHHLRRRMVDPVVSGRAVARSDRTGHHRIMEESRRLRGELRHVRRRDPLRHAYAAGEDHGGQNLREGRVRFGVDSRVGYLVVDPPNRSVGARTSLQLERGLLAHGPAVGRVRTPQRGGTAGCAGDSRPRDVRRIVGLLDRDVGDSSHACSNPVEL